LAWTSAWLLLVGSLLGIALGAVLWNESYATLWLTTLRYKGTMALYEWLFSAILMLSLALCERTPAGGSLALWLRGTIALLASTNLLYHFPFLFAIAAHLQTALPDAVPLAAPVLDAATFRQHMARPEILAKAAHVVLASIAVSGTALLGLSLDWRSRGVAISQVLLLQRWGAMWALLPSLLQMLVGPGLIVALPAAWQQRVMGGDIWATGLLGTSVVLSFFLLQDLAALAFGEDNASITRRVLTNMLLIVFLMTGVLWLMRG
jgi:hypothetical protein